MHFKELLPEIIFETFSLQGFHPTGALFPLNSYENRVYEVDVELEGDPRASIIAKYYRPHRWSEVAIAQEHLFLKALSQAEIPVVSSLPLKNHITLVDSVAFHKGFHYAFFPKFKGREHAETTNNDRQWLGRMLARLHRERFALPPNKSQMTCPWLT